MYHVDVSNKEGYIFDVMAKQYEFKVDMNGAQGITPPDTLLASLGTCIGVYVRKYADGGKLDIPSFTVSVDALEGITTGISAADRARTIQVAAGDTCRPHDLAEVGDLVQRCPELREQAQAVRPQFGIVRIGAEVYLARRASPMNRSE